MEIAGVAVSLPALVALGLLVGLLAGMFGVGGGFLLTPLLGVLFDIPLPIAVGTGLCQMVGASTVALLRYRKLGHGDVRFAVLLAGGSLLGVTEGERAILALEGLGASSFGGQSTPVVSIFLYAAYVAFLLVIGAMLWRQGRSAVDALDYVRRGPLARLRVPPFVDLPAVPLSAVSATVIAYVGLGLGFLSGLLGVGGGVALIPILLYGFGFPFRQAAGTGISVVLLTSSIGTLAHARSGHVHLGLAMVLLVGSGVAAQFGALLTARVSARKLRKGLAVVVLLTAALVAWDLARQLA